jgi:hypothetical protein
MALARPDNGYATERILAGLMLDGLCLHPYPCCFAALLQVTFSTSHFKLGDPRLDKDFTLDLKAHLGSKVSKKPRLTKKQIQAADGSKGSAAGAAPASKEIRMIPLPASKPAENTIAAASAGTADHLTIISPYPAVSGSSGLEIPSVMAPAQTVAEASAVSDQPHWEQESSLKCSVSLNMRLRLPHPLSIVPRPLLSTAAGLVAKLTMQALLPSFLELLSTDYSRWAAGSSTSTRQAVAAGSLVPVAGAEAAGSVNGVQGKGVGAVLEVVDGMKS